MDKSLQRSLSLLDLDSKAIRFFEASFKLGPVTINEVAKAARLQRSTAYLIAQELLQKGFLLEDLKAYRKKVFTVDPKKILTMIAARQRQLRRQELELEEQLPELQSLYQLSEFRPKVKVYEGNNGLLAIWRDILSAKSDILLWTNQETETAFFDENAHNQFVEERIKKRLPIRVLAVDNKRAKQLIPSDQRALRHVKFLPTGVTFSAETYLYDQKIAMLDYNQDIIGVTIESEPISKAQRAIFENSWNSLP